MVKKITKITFMILVSFLLFFTMQVPIVQASNISIDTVTDGADNFFEAGKNHKDESGQPVQPFDQTSLKNVSDVVYNILLIIGIIAAVIMGLVIGIKLMLGSASEKAEIKQLIPPYVVGCIVVFGAFAIWKIVVELFNQTQA